MQYTNSGPGGTAEMCFNKAGKEDCNGGVKSRGKRKSREAVKEEGRREGKCASPPYMELIWFL